MILAAAIAAGGAASAGEMTMEDARAKWDTICSTQRMKGGVPEAGRQILDVLANGEVAPERALAFVRRAAEGKELNELELGKIRDHLEELRGGGMRGEVLERNAYFKIEERPPEPAKPAPAAAYTPGATWFAAGSGPQPKERWRGDVDRADAYAAASPGGFGWSGEADRWIVYLMKDASSWWSSAMPEFFKGSDAYFLAGVVIVPKPDQKFFTVVDRNDPFGWKAAYIFAERGGKWTQLESDKAKWIDNPDVPLARGGPEAPKGYLIGEPNQ